MRMDCQRLAPATLPLGMTRYPLYRKLGGPQVRSRRVRKISPPPGFDPRIFQPVASRYTGYAIPAHVWVRYLESYRKLFSSYTTLHRYLN
jgi:hypothetical protein